MKSPSPHIEMSSASNPAKPKSELSPQQFSETQTKLRETYQNRFNSLVISTQASLDDYNSKLKDGTFEDADSEPADSGEQRKAIMQSSISRSMDKLEQMKAILDSNEPIPSFSPQIEANYTYKNPDTHKVELQETIELDIEKTLSKYTTLFQETNIQLPDDFKENITLIWERNREAIEQAIEEGGFDEMIVAPANTKLDEIQEKMKMEKGYYTCSNFDDGGGFSGAKSVGVEKDRIILVHKAQNLTDRPELKSTKGLKAQDLDINNSLSLEDYIFFQRSYFKETGKHLDEDGWTWLLKTKSGTRFVCSSWNPSDRKLSVDAADAGNSYPNLGCRPSRYFV